MRLPPSASLQVPEVVLSVFPTLVVPETAGGKVFTGASFTAAIVIVCVSLSAAACLSVAVKVTVRLPLLGASLLLLNIMARAVA